ncbi:MAG: type II toxin-antitoxin system RelE/ParE family toxin [bacterium]|nr:type II toxin-antitoxin system RelE/ParE family toxin [bacterium]
MKFEVELLEQAVEFLLSLPVKMQAKAQRTIELLKEFGYQLPEPHSKKLTGVKDLYELRVKHGSDICRFFYFHWKGKIYIITAGNTKKTNKTDQNQIDRAVRLMTKIKKEKED